jgi:TonB family protein
MPQADEEAHTNFTRVEVPQPPLDERIEPLVTLPDELLLEEPLELPKRPAPSYESPSSPAPQGAATFPYLAREQTKPAQAANAKPTAAATNSAPPAAQQPPRIIRPQWPRVIRKGFTGRVLIEVQIASDGRAVRATLIEGTGNAAWDRALRETFEQARYIPGFTNGMPAACTHRFRVTFRHN